MSCGGGGGLLDEWRKVAQRRSRFLYSIQMVAATKSVDEEHGRIDDGRRRASGGGESQAACQRPGSCHGLINT